MAIKKNISVEEAMEIYDELAADEALQYKIYLRKKFIMDNNNLMRTKEEEGLQRGMQKGLQKGMQKGMQKGLKEERKKIIRSMKKSGMSNEEIARVTELALEEVEKI